MLMPNCKSVSRVLMALAIWGAAISVADAQQLPVPSAGVIPDVPGATDKPDPSRSYKFAFDVVSMGGPANFSSALTSVARVLNTYRGYGVPADHIEATAVFHGATIVLVTKDETYAKRTGVKANPNIALLQQLAAAGVKMVVCGVSARDQNYVAADLVPQAHMNLSATVTLFELQSRGFVKIER